jgi:hypothetical protein
MEKPTAIAMTASLLSEEDIVRHYASYRALMTGGATDKQKAEAAIDLLYSAAGLPPPAIFWCQSFYQMLTMPSLVIGIMHSDMWELIAASCVPLAGGKQWPKHWEKVWPEIWLNGGMPLLTGMNRTSRIAAHYGHLEGALISKLKEQLAEALRSGRLDYLQRKLKREMYRLYWARHELANDFAKEHWVRTKLDVFSEAVYLRNQNAGWHGWDQISALDPDIQALGDGIGQLFRTLSIRLGGEPVSQDDFILELPAGIAWIGTADLLLSAFPEHLQRRQSDVSIWIDLAHSAGSIICLDGIAFVCEKPTALHLTDRRRLHDTTAAALTFSDGFAEYAWQGVLVPPFVIEEPESITPTTIETCDNAEVRRVMLERYGTAKYLLDGQIQPVQEDDFGTLFRKEMRGDEALVMVKVVNSTPEPDGTYRNYFLRVPPNMETAKQAVAWTFGLDEQQYDPSVQS